MRDRREGEEAREGASEIGEGNASKVIQKCGRGALTKGTWHQTKTAVAKLSPGYTLHDANESALAARAFLLLILNPCIKCMKLRA